jgi:ATP-binding cassette subfamily F protein uup
VKVLSGGERARLLLARLFAEPSNFLVLDEPTNDLDLETLDLLEETLGEYPGTVLVVSHDRDFLDRVATQIVAAEGDGRFGIYAGGYSDMLSQRRMAEAKAQPEKKSRDAAPAGKTRAPSNRAPRLNFSEMHLLNTLPAKIETWDKTIAALQAELSDPGLYARDAKKFADLCLRLEEARATRAADEELWLGLELKREEVQG